MKKEEANKIIAEYMDRRCSNCGSIDLGSCCNFILDDWHDYGYHIDLNQLVPVWEKMGKFQFMVRKSIGENYHSRLIFQDEVNHFQEYGITPQEAAAITTAKAILELNK